METVPWNTQVELALPYALFGPAVNNRFLIVCICCWRREHGCRVASLVCVLYRAQAVGFKVGTKLLTSRAAPGLWVGTHFLSLGKQVVSRYGCAQSPYLPCLLAEGSDVPA